MQLAQTKWFPQRGSQNVVGRVVDIQKPHSQLSREAGKQIYVMVPAMQTKVLKDSSDDSFTELKPHNKDRLCAEYPGAWEYYEQSKAGTEPAKAPVVDGMPIDRADFMAKEKLAWLKLQGWSTVEQLAEMSDEQVQSLGPGARNWRKKAKELLTKG